MTWHALAAVASLALASCFGEAKQRGGACVGPESLPAVTVDRDGRRAMDLSVLIYNVEGLPRPVRKKRGADLRAIADVLAQMRARDEAPDVVMLQEAFSDEAAAISVLSGYPYVVAGPAAGDQRTIRPAAIPGEFRRAARWRKGERSPKVLSSGLFILSEFPIIWSAREPFSAAACAGYDCLANKGVLLARVWVPGLPTSVDLLTTHMNSQRAARVKLERTHEAHRYQVDESADFLARVRDERNPLIFAGDFNMRGEPGRFEYFKYRKPYRIVRHYCTVTVDDCDVRMPWGSDAPWLDSQDLQAFADGTTVRIRPVRVEALFDGPETGGKLSDHDGDKVTYRLSWPGGASDVGERLLARARREGGEACLPVREAMRG